MRKLKIKKVIGLLMIELSFLVLFVVLCLVQGIAATLFVFGVSAVITLLLMLGTWFLGE